MSPPESSISSKSDRIAGMTPWELLDMFFEQAPLAILLLDQAACVMRANQQFLRVFGYVRVCNLRTRPRLGRGVHCSEKWKPRALHPKPRPLPKVFCYQVHRPTPEPQILSFLSRSVETGPSKTATCRASVLAARFALFVGTSVHKPGLASRVHERLFTQTGFSGAAR